MIYLSSAVVSEITGRAWIRNSDGSLTELRQGSDVPVGSDIVTASGAMVTLQVENGMPIVIGESREVAVSEDLAGPLADPSEAAVAAPKGTDSDRLLASLQAGQDPFEVLDPTAATLTGGSGDDGGGSFVRLARILELTSPLDLAYPNPGRGVDTLDRASSGGSGAGDAGDPNNAPIAVNDSSRSDEQTAVRGNLLTNDSDSDGDPLSIVSINDRPVTGGGIAVTGSNGGTFIVQPDGSYVFVPGNSFQHLPEGQIATTMISYALADPSGAISTSTLEITVEGVNDPALISASKPGDDAGVVKEDEVTTANGNLNVVDADDGQSFFVAVVDRAGIHGTFSIDANGSWVYNLNQADPRVQALAVGESLTETFTVATADGTTGQVVITINGTNDAPVITGTTTGGIKEDGPDATVSGQLTQHDVDTSDTHTWTVSNDGKGAYGSFTVDSTGKWTYTLDNGSDKVQVLKDGETVTDTLTVTVDDGHGGTATQVITVDITGTNDAAIVTPSKPGDDAGKVQEDKIPATSGKLDVTDKDTGEAVFTAQTDAKGEHGKFSIDADGNWKYTLDDTDPKVQALAVGERLTETFTVTTADGTPSKVTVTIDGTNDAPTLTGKTDGEVAEDGTTTAGGKLNVADVDTSDTHTWTVSNDGKGTYGSFTVDKDGNWKYELDNASDKVQALKGGEKVSDTITVTVDDGHGGTATQIIKVDITGTNDVAVVTPSKPGDDAGKVQEDKIPTTGGKLDVTDKDAGEAVFKTQTDAKGEHGKFSIDANGNWKYTLDDTDPKVQALAVGEKLTETFTVTTVDGPQSTVTIMIEGTNDDPALSGKTEGIVAEDGMATGKLDVADVDTSDTHTWNVSNDGKGTYGSFTVDKDGNWKYELDNASDKVQALKGGEKVTDTIKVTVDDGHGGTATKVITVDITGTSDAAVVTPSKPGDDKGTVKEDTTQTTGGKLDVTDKDAGEAVFKTQTDAKGEHGKFSIDADGNWKYTLDDTDPKVQALAVGEKLTETVTVSTADGTKSTVTITIDGTNDKPTLTGKTDGMIAEDGTTTAGGKLDVADADTSDTHTWTVSNDGKGTYGSFTVDKDGNWKYELDNASDKVQALKGGEKVTDTIKVTVDDGQGGTAFKDVTVTITGTNDAAVVSPSKPGDDAGTVQEDKISTANGKLDVTDKDAGEAAFKPQTGFQGEHGKFSIDANGNWKYTLDDTDPKVQALAVGEKLTETFTVTTADGTTGTGTVTITINGTNDAPTIAGQVAGDVTEGGAKDASGQLTKHDVDANDKHSWSLTNDGKGTYGSFTLDQNGKWTYKLDNANPAVKALKDGEHLTDTISATVDDGHGGKATQTITIKVDGTSDGATITPSKPGDDAGTVQEDATQAASGKLNVVDSDAGESVFRPQTNFQGQYGKFSIDANGNWSFKLDNNAAAIQQLGAKDSLTETFTVTTADGTKGQVVITIKGTNDAPTVARDVTGNVKEDGTLTTTGQLTKADIDVTDKHTWSVNNEGKGQYGSFTVDQSGKWTYTLDNKSAQVQALAEGQKVTDTIKVTVYDGNGGTAFKDIVVTVTGTDDAPTLSGDVSGAVKEDSTLTTTGQLTKADIDVTDKHTWSVNNEGKGQYGTFTVDQSGKWTYTLDNGSAKVQALVEGQAVIDTIKVTVDDGKGGTAFKDVTVTITGTNDAATITGQATGTVNEDKKVLAAGKLTVSDVDAGQSSVVAQASVPGKYGTFSVDANGNWTYQLNNSLKAVQDLPAGKVLKEAFEVTSADGSAKQTVTVDVVGTNDAPVAADNATSVNAGSGHAFTTAEFNFNDGAEGDPLQSVIITRLPTDGTLTLNGQAVSVNAVISAADIASGKLVYTPSAAGQDTSFGFQVRDNGGTANGGKDTSGEYNFAIKINSFISGDNDDSGTGTKPPLNGGSGDDVILGDKGGTVTTVEPGKNYNIAIVVDTSGSMREASGTEGLSRIQLTINALKNLANSLKGHDGIVNVALIGFETKASTKYTVNGLTASNAQGLIKAIEALKIIGLTNYEGAFDEALKWFNKQPSSSNGQTFEKLTYFLTDGDPTANNQGANGGRNGHIETNFPDMQDAIVKFKALTDMGTKVHAIGIGSGVNESYLKFFDNSNVTGMGEVKIDGSTITGATGQPQIVNTAQELAAALQGGSSSTDPAAVGNDIINGGAGDDILFGDTINTDGNVLNWAAVGGRPADLAQGSGLKALQVFLEMRDGHAPSKGDLYQYIRDHHADLNVADDPRGSNDTIHGDTGNDILYGQGGNDTLYGDDGDDIIYGGAGDDKLHGGDGSDLLHGGSENDTLEGGNGNDRLVGGKGDDTLIGGAGNDTFKWELGDQGTTAKPAIDTIKDFSLAKPADGGDVLDLRDLLVGEKDGTLTKYLNFHKEGNNTVIDVNTQGKLASQGADQKIVLENVDLTQGGQLNNQAIINDLLQKGKLNVDPS